MDSLDDEERDEFVASLDGLDPDMHKRRQLILLAGGEIL